jgi:uncharacterized MAPEG superfamily protein
MDATAGVSPAGTSSRWEAHAPWAGVAFVALFLAGVLIAGDPGTKDGAKIADHFATDRTTILIGMYLAGLGVLASFVWVWSLRTALSRPGADSLTTTVLVTAHTR